MLDALFDQVAKYVDRDETRELVQLKVIKPALRYVLHELRWLAWAFAVVMLLQTVLLAGLVLGLRGFVRAAAATTTTTTFGM